MVFEIHNVRLPQDDQRMYTVRCEGGKVVEVRDTTDEAGADPEIKAKANSVDGRGGLLLPSLCHSHIHLDKCYILDRGEPLITGDFGEALRVTSDVKATFKDNAGDLYARGDRLVRASVEAGVTSMRAHVEVDKTVGEVCLDVGLRLKDAWSGICDIHISMFMQDPLFDAPEEVIPGTNASVFAEALAQRAPLSSAVGSAPYVERTRAQQLANIRFILALAIQHGLHADFHLDYDLAPLPDSADADSAPLIYYLLAQLHQLQWAERMPERTVVVGHATRLTLFSEAQLRDLRARIGDLPVFFVGLPQSDVYMMGRGCAVPPRGTLDVCRLRAEYGLRVVMAVNNVGNAFTPQGAPDPLGLCALGVALYQDGTASGCRHLVEAVSIDSRHAIGDLAAPSFVTCAGSAADFVILHDNFTVQSAALDPCYDRTTIKDGKVVAWRKAHRWVSGKS